jgi:hypothetical protein
MFEGAYWVIVRHWVSTLKHFLQILQNVEFTDAKDFDSL